MISAYTYSVTNKYELQLELLIREEFGLDILWYPFGYYFMQLEKDLTPF